MQIVPIETYSILKMQMHNSFIAQQSLVCVFYSIYVFWLQELQGCGSLDSPTTDAATMNPFQLLPVPEVQEQTV